MKTKNQKPYKFKVGDKVTLEMSTAKGEVVARYRNIKHYPFNVYSIFFNEIAFVFSKPDFNFQWSGNTIQIKEDSLVKI